MYAKRTPLLERGYIYPNPSLTCQKPRLPTKLTSLEWFLYRSEWFCVVVFVVVVVAAAAAVVVAVAVVVLFVYYVSFLLLLLLLLLLMLFTPLGKLNYQEYFSHNANNTTRRTLGGLPVTRTFQSL